MGIVILMTQDRVRAIRCIKEIRDINTSGGLYTWFAWKLTNIGDLRWREGLCEKLKLWLQEINKMKLPLKILIDGAFITYEPKPKYIDIVCAIEHDDIRKLGGSAKKKLQELCNNMKVYDEKYNCVIKLKISMSGDDDVKLYNEALGWFELDKGDDITIFRVSSALKWA
jgi:hypothetical protein